MNEIAERELKIVVERTVRPVRATMVRKRKMREELLAHLTAIFEEEAETLGDEQAAFDQAKRRFGDSRELSVELQGPVSRWGQVGSIVEKYSFQSGESVLHLATASVLWMCLMAVAGLLAAVPVSVLRGKSADFGMLAHVSLVTSVVMAAFTFLFLFLSERIARSLCGEESERSLSKVVLYCLASLTVFPALASVTYLAMSLDLAASLAHLRFACYFAPTTPLIFLLMGRLMIEEIRYKQQWASLEIGE